MADVENDQQSTAGAPNKVLNCHSARCVVPTMLTWQFDARQLHLTLVGGRNHGVVEEVLQHHHELQGDGIQKEVLEVVRRREPMKSQNRQPNRDDHARKQDQNADNYLSRQIETPHRNRSRLIAHGLSKEHEVETVLQIPGFAYQMMEILEASPEFGRTSERPNEQNGEQKIRLGNRYVACKFLDFCIHSMEQLRLEKTIFASIVAAYGGEVSCVHVPFEFTIDHANAHDPLGDNEFSGPHHHKNLQENVEVEQQKRTQDSADPPKSAGRLSRLVFNCNGIELSEEAFQREAIQILVQHLVGEFHIIQRFAIHESHLRAHGAHGAHHVVVTQGGPPERQPAGTHGSRSLPAHSARGAQRVKHRVRITSRAPRARRRGHHRWTIPVTARRRGLSTRSLRKHEGPFNIGNCHRAESRLRTHLLRRRPRHRSRLQRMLQGVLHS
mmetsp:Transcript_108845/g.351379  ORF Transcript_108845/g.351379 Transcript_108845/m.351379 type:complete len:441 (+) Transcript_108845:311-1633(+)